MTRSLEAHHPSGVGIGHDDVEGAGDTLGLGSSHPKTPGPQLSIGLMGARYLVIIFTVYIDLCFTFTVLVLLIGLTLDAQFMSLN